LYIFVNVVLLRSDFQISKLSSWRRQIIFVDAWTEKWFKLHIRRSHNNDNNRIYTMPYGRNFRGAGKY